MQERLGSSDQSNLCHCTTDTVMMMGMVMVVPVPLPRISGSDACRECRTSLILILSATWITSSQTTSTDS